MSTKKPAQFNRQAVYTGRRLNHAGKVTHRFELLPGREAMSFLGVVGVTIGHTYRCTAQRIAKKPEWVTDRPREDNAAWEAEDALVDEHNAKRRAEEKIRKLAKPSLREAIQALRKLTKGMDYFQRVKLVTYLVEQSGREK